MGCVIGAVRMMTKRGMYGGVNVDGTFNAEWLVECRGGLQSSRSHSFRIRLLAR